MHLLVDDQSGRRGAALAGGTEGTPEHTLKREVEVGIVHDDLGVLATHLEREPLVRPPARFTDLRAGLGRSGERDHRHIRMIHDRRTALRRPRAPS